MREPREEPDGGAVGPLERGLEIIEVLGRSPARPADLVRSTGLVRSTVDRVIGTLEWMGYVRRHDREARLAPRLMELGNAYLTATGVTPFLTPLALGLSETLDESVSLAVADGDGARFVAQSPRRRTMSVSFRIGDLLPAEICAPGAIFAAGWGPADWDRWRRRAAAGDGRPRFAVPAAPAAERSFRSRVAAYRDEGWAEDDQLIEPGLVAVALPVRDGTGATVAALSVVSHTSRNGVASLRDRALPELRACADRMERALALPPRSPGAAAPGVDRSRETKQELGPGFLQSLHRGLAVMAALDTAPGRTISETALATGLPRATARRALLTLRSLGYASEAGGRFSLLPRVLDLGYAGLSGLTLQETARPHLRRLAEQVGDSVSLAVLDGTDIRYVARSPATRVMRVTISIGTRFPAYATSMGRVLLAGLAEDAAAGLLALSDRRRFTERTRTGLGELTGLVAAARRDGFALVDQELEEGLRSIAVPVRDRTGGVIAALNVACHAAAESPGATRDRLLPALAAAAAALEADLAVFTDRITS